MTRLRFSQPSWQLPRRNCNKGHVQGEKSGLAEVIARHGLSARHSLGQHFLLDPRLNARIAALAGDLAGRHMIEIGPGPGGLTRALLAREAASVTAIEIDPRAVAALGELAAASAGRLKVVAGDALTFEPAELAPPPRVLIGNLPYNIATALLLRWLRWASEVERMTLMFQREVAERIAAAPGSGAYGRLSVLAQWTCRVESLITLPPGAFVPPPKVSSTLLALVPRPIQPGAKLLAAMERLTAAAFGQRRKMLRSALRRFGAEALLAEAAIAPERRAETLTVAEFAALAELICSRE